MHIVYVTWLFAQSEREVLKGGIANYLYKISKYMQRQGYKVTIVVAGKEKRYWQYDGIPIYTVAVPFEKLCGLYNMDKFLVPILREFAFRKALKKLDDESPITLVQYAAGKGTGMLHDKKYPSVLRASTYSRIEKKGLIPETEYKVLVLYERLAAKSFEYIFAPSRSWGIPLQKEIKRKITIIPTPYEMEEGLEEDESIYNKKLRCKKYFLFFGKLYIRKGIGTLTRCIKEILSENPDYLMCFVGPIGRFKGENLLHLLKQAAGEYRNRIVYVGILKHEQLYPIIRHAECILMPSLNDNIPNACLEALLLNGIVIGTRGASFDEIYKDGESGYLIEPDNSSQLVQKISMVVSMSEEEKIIMRDNAKEVLKNYTFEKLGKRLERYYKSVIADSHKHVR